MPMRANTLHVAALLVRAAEEAGAERAILAAGSAVPLPQSVPGFPSLSAAAHAGAVRGGRGQGLVSTA